MVRRATKKTKERPLKHEKKLVVVSAEGKNKTEKTYFNEFNSSQKNYRIIPARGNSTDPINIVIEAINSAKRENLDFNEGDRAFAIFDTDFGKEAIIREAIQVAQNSGVEVLLSNPCFEIWLLLHFRFSTKGYNSNSEVQRELVHYWPNYEKNISSYDKISKDTKKAIEGAKKIVKFNIDTYGTAEIVECNASTDVYKLVEMLMQTE